MNHRSTRTEPTVEPDSASKRLDIEPFKEWLERLCKVYTFVEVAELTTLDDTYIRRVIKGEFGTVALEVATRAFEAAHEPIQIHYDVSGEVETRWCPTCRDETSTGADRICPWCEGKTATANPDEIASHTCPECGASKRAGSRSCRPCATRPQRKPYKISEDLLQRAYRMYCEEALSLQGVAERIINQTGYKNVHSAVVTLQEAFAHRGWGLRTKSEAVKLAHARLAQSMPQCRYVKASTGKRCEKKTARPNGRCTQHDPARIAEGIERLNRRRARLERQAELEPA